MKKFILLALLMVGMISTVRAESSATAYDGKYYSQQVFVDAYNNFNAAIARDNVVIIDASQAVNPNLYLGSYITVTNTTDSIFVFGVTDESINSGSIGRIAVRGPHKAVSITAQSGANASGSIISASNVPGKFGFASTADGTASGRLGYILSSTATTDTGDATGTFWIWVDPRSHK